MVAPMQPTQTITLVLVSDDHYVVLLAALIRSVEANLAPGNKLQLWVVSDQVTTANKQKLASSIDKQITTLHWKEVEDAVPTGLQLPIDRSSYPLNIYMRLFIPYFLPADVDKALYLDADMIALADISQLWATDISKHALAAVQDPRVLTFDNHWGGVLNYKQLGMPGHTPYFNTGLLLLNLTYWRNQDTAAKILDVINNNKRYANYPDQYGMNIVVANQWLPLDPLWNHFATFPHPAPYIIHFVERKPIYKAYKNNKEYKRLFLTYLADTAWRHTKPIGESSRYAKKIRNIWAKITNKN